MPTIYRRQDLALRLFADGGDAVLTIDSPEGTRSIWRVPRRLVDRVSEIPAPLRDAVHSSISGMAAVAQTPSAGSPETLSRVTVEVGVRDWATMEWESLQVGGRIVVRTSPVRPRVLQIPITFPIRVLEVDGTPVVSAAIEATFFGGTRGNAYIDAHTTMIDTESFARREQWATVDVLHLHALPDGANLLTTEHASPPGTAGWLLRFADRFQTRLIVLDGPPSSQPAYRRLAQTIIDRGGPAVLLFGNDPTTGYPLYAGIPHDRPLDWIRGYLSDSALFSGAGGEEALRYTVVVDALFRPRAASSVTKAYVARFASPRKLSTQPSLDAAAVRSAIVESARDMRVLDVTGGVRFDQLWGTRALRFGHLLAAKLPRHGLVAIDLGARFEALGGHGRVLSVDDLAVQVGDVSRSFRSISRNDAVRIFSAKIDDIVRSAAAYHYEDHESEGMLPLAAKIHDARSLADALRQPEAKPRRAPRHVNSAFYTAGSGGTLEMIPQPRARLRPGEVVHLGVQIGPQDKRIAAFGPATFFDEKVRWEGDGAWLEIGVTGIDFDVVGDPVQEFYLPRDEPSDLVAFAVRPLTPTTVPGVARLRFTIYQRDNVVQSFLVGAALQGAPRDAAAAIARALGVPKSDARKIGAAGYIARLEYANAASFADRAHVTPRGLTIVANDSAGDKVTTIKGDGLFLVRKEDHSEIVGAARKTLEEASERGAAYRYQSFQGKPNAGDPTDLEDVLPGIAYAGWQIYNALVPDPNDQDRIRSLIEKGDGIHAAHLDFSGVIPWSMIYDRPVFYDKTAAPPSVCRASMPDDAGTMPSVECGGPGCLLNAARNEERRRTGQAAYTEHAVICPRRFWGFMFPIDVPAQKLDKLDEKPRSLPEKIEARAPIAVVAGYNKELDFATTHVEDLKREFLTKATVTASTGRVPVWTLIKDNDPDIVYFYCHALATTATQTQQDRGPALDFGRGFEGVIEDVLFPADFGGRPAWTHAPLVFINGCSTVGFSPYAPSKFIKQFIQAKHASAVVGTETTIVEMLAKEVATSFLQDLLARQSAGDALLRARRLLLAKNNPLGLMYTIYGSSRLKLAP